jgi:hypothetical protein
VARCRKRIIGWFSATRIEVSVCSFDGIAPAIAAAVIIL